MNAIPLRKIPPLKYAQRQKFKEPQCLYACNKSLLNAEKVSMDQEHHNRIQLQEKHVGATGPECSPSKLTQL